MKLIDNLDNLLDCVNECYIFGIKMCFNILELNE